jgi:hypothetical protein
VNLWLRLIGLIVASFFRPRLDPAREVSRLSFRIWPHDLDLSLHMNTGATGPSWISGAPTS